MVFCLYVFGHIYLNICDPFYITGSVTSYYTTDKNWRKVIIREIMHTIFFNYFPIRVLMKFLVGPFRIFYFFPSLKSKTALLVVPSTDTTYTYRRRPQTLTQSCLVLFLFLSCFVFVFSVLCCVVVVVALTSQDKRQKRPGGLRSSKEAGPFLARSR